MTSEIDAGVDGDGPVAALLDALAAAAPAVREALADASPGTGTAGTEPAGENPSGQERLAADVRVDRLLADRLLAVDGVDAYASEEREGILGPVGRDDDGDVDGLAVAVDPLDGSANLASNNAVGTVVGVYDAVPPASGRSLVAAAAVVYGPLTTMAAAGGPAGRPGRATAGRYRLEGGERRRVGPLALPADAQVYGFGGRRPAWSDAFRAYADDVAGELKRRYAGAMVADVAQVLARGGVYAYPALADRPRGKLRYCYEAAPAAYLVAAAGGRSTDGDGSLLDRTPGALHARTPVGLGTPARVERLETAMADGRSRT